MVGSSHQTTSLIKLKIIVKSRLLWLITIRKLNPVLIRNVESMAKNKMSLRIEKEDLH